MLWSSSEWRGIGRYDPMKKSWTSYQMPPERTAPTRFMSTTGPVWATDWPANAIQRFDPRPKPLHLSERQTQRADPRDAGAAGEAWRRIRQ